MKFDTILYRAFGPYVDLRFFLGETVVSEIRVLGPVPGKITIIEWIYATFHYKALTLVVCVQDQEAFIEYVRPVVETASFEAVSA